VARELKTAGSVGSLGFEGGNMLVIYSKSQPPGMKFNPVAVITVAIFRILKSMGEIMWVA
jgi:hypothetical protein